MVADIIENILWAILFAWVILDTYRLHKKLREKIRRHEEAYHRGQSPGLALNGALDRKIRERMEVDAEHEH